jgi:hypothetical protein
MKFKDLQRLAEQSDLRPSEDNQLLQGLRGNPSGKGHVI